MVGQPQTSHMRLKNLEFQKLMSTLFFWAPMIGGAENLLVHSRIMKIIQEQTPYMGHSGS